MLCVRMGQRKRGDQEGLGHAQVREREMERLVLHEGIAPRARALSRSNRKAGPKCN